MRIKILLITTLFFQISMAQNAKDILEKTSDAYKDISGFILSFTLNTEDTAEKVTYTHDGKAYLKGNKFKIDVPDGITWFDGKTQWVYMKGGDEVNVSNPTGEELAAISPVALLSIYKSGFKLNYLGEKTEKGKSVYRVEMIPQQKNSEITKFILSIDKSTYYFTSIILKGKDGVNNNLTITNTKKGAGLTDKAFIFDKNEYPDLEIIDLR